VCALPAAVFESIGQSSVIGLQSSNLPGFLIGPTFRSYLGPHACTPSLTLPRTLDRGILLATSLKERIESF
jgi:hypothetical protein